jgi:NitT/TauT family transport system substrate-binding protein
MGTFDLFKGALRMNRRLVLGFAIFALIGSLAWVPRQGQAKPVEVIRVGVSPVISSAGFYLAHLRGYFAEAGLKVELLPFGGSGPEIIPLVASDQFQVGGGSVAPGMFNAIARGSKVRIVADKARIDPNDAHDAFLVRRDLIESGRYKTGADLKGMRVGLATTGKTNILAIGLERYLRKHGLELSDVELVGASFPAQMAAFKGEQIDGACAIEPFVAKAEDAGLARRVWGYEEVMPNFQVAVVFFSENFATNQPEQARAFMVAYVRGLRDYLAAFRYGQGAEGVIDDMARALRVSDKSLFQKMRVTGFDPDGCVDAPSVEVAQNWFAGHGLIPRTVDVSSVVDASFCRHAREVLGPFSPGKKKNETEAK